jgi:Domain of unknown function (DUF1905)
MKWRFVGEVIEWRGPSPFYFVALPPNVAEEVHDLAPSLTYGWGVVPVHGLAGRTAFATSLFPKNNGYLLPLTKKVREAEGIDRGQRVSITLQPGRK